MGWLDGKTALVTGASSGIGRAVVERYVEEGARVVAFARSTGALDSLARQFPGKVVASAGDVTRYSDLEAAVAVAVREFGTLDILVGNAGIFDFFRPLDRYDAGSLDETFDEVFKVNVRGYLYAAHAASAALRASTGCMIFTTSIAGFHASCGGIIYTAAKHAIVGIIRQLAHEMAPSVRVNGVGPGGTITPLSGPSALGQADRSILDIPNVAEQVAKSVPLGIAQYPDDHTGLYVLLASHRNARAITGEVLMSDGGVGVRPV